MASDSVERERTWLVHSLPDPLPTGTPVAQGYVVADGEVAVRVRRACSRRTMTVKGRGTRRRIELEWDLTAAQFDAVWPLTRGARVEKIRHEVPLGGRTAEVDVFTGSLHGLVLVEVEFDDDAAMASFAAPDWFGAEVSDDPRYANAALALHGRPEDHPSPAD